MIRHLNSLLLISLLVILAGCGDKKNDDLTTFMQEANQSLSTKVEPLPQVEIFVPMEYNVDHALNDPFKPRKVTTQSAQQPNLNRPKEVLESFSLETLKFVGTMSKNKETYALIRTPENMLYQVKVGNHLGSNLGMITAITENKETMQQEITLKETIQDELTGDWTTRVTKLALQENE